jgi:hypothetical protein
MDRSRLIGWMKKPAVARGPKLNSAIAQPQTMITSGVRQLEEGRAGQRSPVVVDMQIPQFVVSRLVKAGPR